MWCLDDFKLGPRIGTGSFGYVRLVKERHGGNVAALKVMRKRRVERLRVQRHVAHEVEVQGHLRHQHVLKLHGIFWDAVRIYMILEHAPGGDLEGLLKKQPGHRFEERLAAKNVAQIVSAVEYCHGLHVMHRDIKPSNILVGHRSKLKLADFGWAVHTYPDQLHWTLCGTLDYLPPEMVHSTSGHSFGVDAWSLGILSYEMLVGQPPFVAATWEETCRAILQGTPSYTKRGLVEADPGNAAKAQADCTSALAQDFVGQLLHRDPATRARPADAAAHPWLRQSSHEGTACEYNAAAFAGA